MDYLFKALRIRVIDMIVEADSVNDLMAKDELSLALEGIKSAEKVVNKRYLYADEAL
jgi:hypothetical protein